MTFNQLTHGFGVYGWKLLVFYRLSPKIFLRRSPIPYEYTLFYLLIFLMIAYFVGRTLFDDASLQSSLSQDSPGQRQSIVVLCFALLCNEDNSAQQDNSAQRYIKILIVATS